MRTLLQIPILRTVTVILTTGVLLTPRTEAICYMKETLLPIRKPVGADLFEIDPGAEVTRDIHPHDSSKQTTCKNLKTCFKLREKHLKRNLSQLTPTSHQMILSTQISFHKIEHNLSHSRSHPWNRQSTDFTQSSRHSKMGEHARGSILYS